MVEGNLGEAVLVLSTDDKQYLDGLMSAKGKAAKWTEEAQKTVEHQGRLNKSFQHVGVHTFGYELLNLAGISGHTRPIIGLLGVSVDALATSFGAATTAAMPWIFAAGAIAAIAYKVYEGYEKNTKSLAELIRKQGEALVANSSLLDKMREYERAIGTLTPALANLKKATEELDAAQRKNQETTLRQQIAMLERAISTQGKAVEVNKAYKSIIDEQMRSGSLGQEAMAGLYLAQRIQNTETEKYLKLLPEEKVQLAALRVELEALARGYADAGQMLDVESKKGAESRKQEIEDWKRVIKEVNDLNTTYKKNATGGAAQMQKAHEKLRAEWAKEDAAIARSNQNLREWYGVGESSAKDMASAMSGAFQGITAGFGNSVAAMIVQGQSFGEAMKNVWRSMAQEFISQIIQMTVRWVIFQALTGGMGGGFASAGDILAANGRAEGGPVKAGTPYWVGEKGEPELFIPGQNGRIIPQSEMQGRGGITVNQTFNVSGLDFSSAEAARKLLRAQAAQMRSGAVDALTFAQAAADQAEKNSGRSRG